MRDTCVSAKRESQISVAMQRLEHLVEECEAGLKGLNDRFGAVLNQEPRPAAGELKNSENGHCDLASAIHSSCRRLENVTSGMRELVERCEV